MITIRRATPDDAERVSRLIEISGGGGTIPLMALVFPGATEKRLQLINRLFRCEANVYLQYKRYIIAEVDGVVEIRGQICL